jgi:DNA-binding SARP family transcriptional activator
VDGAAATCADAVDRWRAVGDPLHVALTLQLAADLARARGDLRAAVASALGSLTAFGSEFDPWFASRALEQLAAACAAAATRGPAGVPLAAGASAAPHATHAAQLLGAAAAVRGRAGVALLRIDRETHLRTHDASEALLGPVAFAAAYAEGEQHGSADAVGLAERTASATLASVPADATDPDASPVTVAAQAMAVGGDSHAAPQAAPQAAPHGAAPRRPAEMDVQVLGPLTVTRGGVGVPSSELTPAKVRELLLYLALHPEGRTKDQVGLALWPDASPAQVRNAFHVTMHQLRRALGRKEAVAYDVGQYALARAARGAPVAVACDVDAVLAAAEAARAADAAAERAGARGADAVAALGADAGALAGWRRALDRAERGPLGEGEDAGDWLAPHQARVCAAWGDGMEALARLHARRGAPDEAAAVLEALVAAEPLREGAHRALMATYAAVGEPARALAHFDALAKRLARDVGAAPARDTRALADAIRRGG